MFPLIYCALCPCLVADDAPPAEIARERLDAVLALPGAAAFWDFHEEAGAPRVSLGPTPLALAEGGPPVAHLTDGPFGHAALFEGVEHLTIPRAEVGALDIHGPDAQVTVVAWLKRAGPGDHGCEAVAGLWNETRAKRQYCLFLNLGIHKSAQQVGAHVSGIGGPTPGHRYCMDAAIGATPVPFEEWHCVAITYDGEYARAYLDGRLDERGDRNPYHYPGGLFDSGPAGSDFTVGAVDRSGEMGNWFTGALGGLAVFDRALSEEELASIAFVGERDDGGD